MVENDNKHTIQPKDECKTQYAQLIIVFYFYFYFCLRFIF